MNAKNVCVVGAGWAGLAAAVSATAAGHRVTVLEASRALGGRARGLAQEVTHALPDGSQALLDNGQHILIGAYRETLGLMRQVGLEPARLLHRLPLRLQYPDGTGLRLPDRAAPWNLLAGVLGAHGWSLGDKWSLLGALRRWQRAGFQCGTGLTVAELCVGIRPQVLDTFINPLCVAALNTPAQQASAQVFLTVLCDTLQATPDAHWSDTDCELGASVRGLASTDLLLPLVDLSTLFPDAAAKWLQGQGGTVRLGERAGAPRWNAGAWHIGDQNFDAVIWATSAPHAVHALETYAAEAQKTSPCTCSGGCVLRKRWSLKPSPRCTHTPQVWYFPPPCWLW